MINRSKKEPIYYHPAEGTKYISASIDKDLPRAATTVLLKLAEKVKIIGPFSISFGHLEMPIADDDNRLQLTVEYYDYTKMDLHNINLVKNNYPDTSVDVASPVVKQDRINRLTVRLPQGKEQDNLSELLVKAAEVVSELGDITLVDLTLFASVEDGFDRPCVVLYYL